MTWVGTKWAIKIDIVECFERVDHPCLLDILCKKIADDRFNNPPKRCTHVIDPAWIFFRSVPSLTAWLS